MIWEVRLCGGIVELTWVLFLFCAIDMPTSRLESMQRP